MDIARLNIKDSDVLKDIVNYEMVSCLRKYDQQVDMKLAMGLNKISDSIEQFIEEKVKQIMQKESQNKSMHENSKTFDSSFHNQTPKTKANELFEETTSPISPDINFEDS